MATKTKKAKRSYTRKATAPSAFTTMTQTKERTVVEIVEIQFPVLIPIAGDTQGIRFSLESNKLECKADMNDENETWENFEAGDWIGVSWDSPLEFAKFLTLLGKLVDDTLYLAGKR